MSIFAFAFALNLKAQESRPWFQDGPWQFPKANPKAKTLPLIKVEGNKFVDSQGKTILLRELYCGRNEGNPPDVIDTALRAMIPALHTGLHYISN